MSALKAHTLVVAILFLSMLTAEMALVPAQVSGGADQRTATAKAESAPLLDAYGDALPPTPFLRLGTIRFRPSAPIVAMAWTSDSKRLATGSQKDNAGEFQLWDAATGKEIRSFGTGVVYLASLAFSPDDKSVAFGGGGGRLTLFEVETGSLLRQAGTANSGQVHFAADGKTIVGVNRQNQITFVETPTLAVKRTIETGNNMMKAMKQLGQNRYPVLAWSKDEKIMALAETDAAIAVIDVATGKRLHLLGHTSPIRAFGFAPDAKLLATAGSDELVHLWDTSTGKLVRDLRGHTGAINALSWSPDGKCLVSGGADKTARFWDVDKAVEVRKIDPAGDIQTLEFSPDGKRLAWSNTVALGIWDASTGKPILDHDEHFGPIGSTAVLDKGARLLTSGGDATIRLWDLKTGRKLNQINAGHAHPEAVAVTADGKWLATAGQDGTIRLLELPAGNVVKEMPMPNSGANQNLAFSPDGRHLAVTGGTRTLIWEIPSGQQLRELKHLEGQMRALTISPDGKMLCTATAEGGLGLVHVWEVATGRQMRPLSIPPNPELNEFGIPNLLSQLVFSPDGKLLAAMGADSPACVWDFTTGVVVRRFQEQDGGTMRGFRFNGMATTAAMAFSCDGRMLATSGSESQVQLWELASGKQRSVLEGHRSKVTSVTFLPDGKTLVAGAADGTVLCWDLAGRDRANPKQYRALTAGEVETQWRLLPDQDAAQAYVALLTLASSPNQALAKLQKQLQPVPFPDPKLTAQAIVDLASEKFNVREKAMADLKKAGDSAWSALREVLDRKPSLELRRRVQLLLGNQSDLVPTPERLFLIRSLELLEKLDMPEARALLQTLADGAPGAWLTEEAKVMLQRM
jgi:WD40 repeat protein